MPLTIEEAFQIMLTKRSYLETKVRDGIKFNLRVYPSDDEVADLVGDVLTSTIESITKGIIFENENKFIGYVLITCWRKYRDEKKKQIIKNTKNKKINDDIFLIEANQLLQGDNQLFMPSEMLTYDLLESIPDTPTVDRTAEVEQETHFYKLYESIFTYLENAVALGEFQLIDLSIFKMYLFYAKTIKKTAEYSGYPYETCKQSIKIIRKRLRKVKAQLEQ